MEAGTVGGFEVCGARTLPPHAVAAGASISPRRAALLYRHCFVTAYLSREYRSGVPRVDATDSHACSIHGLCGTAMFVWVNA